MNYIAILGRQPALGLAELESLYGAHKVEALGQNALLNLNPQEINFDRLGGSLKLGKILATVDSADWHEIQETLKAVALEHAATLPEGKLSLGLSVYGLKPSSRQIMATGLELKKIIRTSSGRSVRLVPNKEPALSSAQVLHNKLTQKSGWELLVVNSGNKTIIAQTTSVQDIESYTARDQKRPHRDAKVGMLPPKLAQIIINLATGTRDSRQETHIMDPFCGTGVLLQEALLMGYFVMGGDIDKRMVDYTVKNLAWARQNFNPDGTVLNIDVVDATNHEYIAPFNIIAAEAYLGRPFTSKPTEEVLRQTIHDCNTIIKKFLRNIARQTKPGFRMCVAIPAWKANSGFKHLPTLDSLEELGYNRLRFEHAAQEDLIYHRPGQIVARELVVLQRK